MPLINGLTKRQNKFVDELLNAETKSLSEAARKAGYSPKRLYETASETVRKSKIQLEIERRKAEMALHCKVTPEMVLGGTVLRATSTIDDCFDDNGNFDIQKARKTGAIHQIKKITKTPNKFGTTVSVELYGKDSAQDKLGNYLGLERLAGATQNVSEALKTRIIEAVEKLLGADPSDVQARKDAFLLLKGMDAEESFGLDDACWGEVEDWIEAEVVDLP